MVPREGTPQRPAQGRLSYPKAGGVVLLAIYGVLCAKDPSVFRFLDGVDLIIHEAGHVVFGIFGEFLALIGGTLMQLFLPAAFVVHFYRREQFYAAAVTLFWLAQSLWNVSVYVGDARAQKLPLLGGDEAIHDWNAILGRLGLLSWDRFLAGIVYGLGLVLFFVSVFWGFRLSYTSKAITEPPS